MMTLIIRTGWDLAVASIGTAVGNTMYKLGNILWDCRDSIKEEFNYLMKRAIGYCFVYINSGNVNFLQLQG